MVIGLMFVAVVVGVPLVVVAVIYLVVPVCAFIGNLFKRTFAFVGREVSDLLRLIGHAITALVFVPLSIGSIVLGRWSASAHYWNAVCAEAHAASACLYRMAIGHPARLLGLTSLVEGLEQRVPEVMAAAPGSDKPKGRSGQFPGYTIVGSLAAGGSGSKLYIAEPDAVKRAIFERNGWRDFDQVVIKTFSLTDGSTLPQILRESRALEPAKKLGLVLDHEESPERFFYVMRYVPGENLGIVSQRLHALSGGHGLSAAAMKETLGYAADIVRTLDVYHKGGLWHKDVKPDNIIVDGRAAHLVDFGLVTPLRSGMTLTTHGTEYFRDPEMVRLALKGVKVHQVDGAKFDVYAAGAVLFSMIENSFPAHGGLSQITKPCPDALRWIVRRAMTDYAKRYESAAAMLADLDVVRAAADPFAVKVGQLPSVSGDEPEAASVEQSAGAAAAAGAAAVAAAAAGAGAVGADEAGTPVGRAGQRAIRWMEDRWREVAGPQGKPAAPKLRVVNWWTGAYSADDVAPVAGSRRPVWRAVNWWTGAYSADDVSPAEERGGYRAPKAGGKPLWAAGEPAAGERRPLWAAGEPAVAGGEAPAGDAKVAWSPAPARAQARAQGPKLSAADQVKSARSRAAAARERARTRIAGRRGGAGGRYSNAPTAGLIGAVVLVIVAVVVGIAAMIESVRPSAPAIAQDDSVRVMIDDAPAAKIETRVKVNVDGVVNAIDGAMTSAAAALAEAPVPGVVLVVNDIVPMPAAVAERIAAMRADLEPKGFRIIGVGEPAGDTASAQLELSLAAEVRTVRGLRPLDAEATVKSLSAWLGSQVDTVDVLVWIAASPEAGTGEAKPNYYVFGPTLDGLDALERVIAERRIREVTTSGLGASAGR